MQDINLYSLLKFYAKKWLWIISLTTIGAASGFVYSSYIQTPLYKSSATLLLVSTEDRKINQDSTLINNYLELLKSRRVLEPVIKNQNQNLSYDELAGLTTATSEKNTEVIKLSIASSNASMSKRLVNDVVGSFKKEVKELYNLDNISIVDTASQASQPYNINTPILTTFTTAASFILAITILFFVYDLNTSKPTKRTKAKKVTKQKKTLVRQGGLLRKIAELLIGTEVESYTQQTSNAKPAKQKS